MINMLWIPTPLALVFTAPWANLISLHRLKPKWFPKSFFRENQAFCHAFPTPEHRTNSKLYRVKICENCVFNVSSKDPNWDFSDVYFLQTNWKRLYVILWWFTSGLNQFETFPCPKMPLFPLIWQSFIPRKPTNIWASPLILSPVAWSRPLQSHPTWICAVTLQAATFIVWSGFWINGIFRDP